MADPVPGTTPVTDRRVAPRGALPRSAQTWIMAGLAAVILAIVVFAGRPEPTARPATMPGASGLAPNTDRLRGYQDRLRLVDERARQQALEQAADRQPAVLADPPPAPAPPDPLAAERRRREYESLFASNVVLSRRQGAQRQQRDESAARTPPTLDEVAEAVVRATALQARALSAADAAKMSTSAAFVSPTPDPASDPRARDAATGPIRAAGPLHRLVEGTVIDTVLTNRLDGSSASPVNCLVTNPVYSHHRQHVLIPAGSRIVGEAKPVQAVGETRLAVTFQRLVMPDGCAYALDRVAGLNQAGDAGLRDQVDHHYWSTFGAAGAVGLISGLAQLLGTVGFGTGDGDRTIVIAGGAGNATTQATSQVMSRFLNRLPTVTIREGHRVKVYLTSDLELPAYGPVAPMSGRPAGHDSPGARP